LATTAKALSHITGWGATFIGSLFLASVTSFPELVVSLSALKIASADMAVGNLLGSNMINLFILSLIDVFYIKAPLLSLVSSVHMITVGLVIIFCSVILISLRIKLNWSFLRLGWDTLFIFVSYLVGMYFIFKLSS
jgi:cation:H+ antiporter